LEGVAIPSGSVPFAPPGAGGLRPPKEGRCAPIRPAGAAGKRAASGREHSERISMWEPGQQRARTNLPLTADINVTSLVDVAFTLLVIFIITAPILQGGVELELPRAEAGPITQAEGVVVSIAEDGTIYLDEAPMASREEFMEFFPRFMQERRGAPVFVRGDRRVAYGEVMELFGLLRQLDVAQVNLVLETPPRATRR
jgi:biopolymer transport protein TolR